MLNWTTIKKLHHDIDPEDFDEIVDIFLGEMETEIQALRKDDCTDTIGCRLHFLKGSALNMGFETFSKLCTVGEQGLATPSTSGIDTFEIEECYKKSKTQFLRQLDQLSKEPLD